MAGKPSREKDSGCKADPHASENLLRMAYILTVNRQRQCHPASAAATSDMTIVCDFRNK